MGIEGQAATAGFTEGAALSARAHFMEITRDSPDEIVGQLAGRDRVHVYGARNVDELRRHRLGHGDHFSRTCFAMVDENSAVHSAIYVHRGYRHVESELDLHGNVRRILAGSARERDDAPTAHTFYSISNLTDVKGMGQALVFNLHAHLGRVFGEACKTTLSPLRSFDENMDESHRTRFRLMEEFEQTRMVIGHLLSAADPVQGFHMGNGARIGDIKLKAGDISGEGANARDHVAMVNFVYDNDPDVLQANAEKFKIAKNAVSHARKGTIGVDECRDIVSKIVFPMLSPALLRRAQIDSADEWPNLRFLREGPAQP